MARASERLLSARYKMRGPHRERAAWESPCADRARVATGRGKTPVPPRERRRRTPCPAAPPRDRSAPPLAAIFPDAAVRFGVGAVFAPPSLCHLAPDDSVCLRLVPFAARKSPTLSKVSAASCR